MIEYKIVKRGRTPHEDDVILNNYGSENWDCFHATAMDFYFKRVKAVRKAGPAEKKPARPRETK